MPESLRDGLDSPMVAFLNRNNRLADFDLRTPRPATNILTLYFAAPLTGGLRLPLLQLNARCRLPHLRRLPRQRCRLVRH